MRHLFHSKSAKVAGILIIVLLAGIAIFSATWTAAQRPISVQTEASTQVVGPEIPPDILAAMSLPRSTWHDYDLMDEAELISIAKTALDVREIKEERITYLKAGQWRRSQGMDYRPIPEHPIFHYTVHGTVGGQMFALGGGCGSDPKAKCEYVETWETGTVAIDAVTGYLFYWSSRDISDIDLASEIIIGHMEPLPALITVTPAIPPTESTVDPASLPVTAIPEGFLSMP